MKKITLWGFEKNPRLKSVPEGLYLVALALRHRGYKATIQLLPREFVDEVKARLPRLKGVAAKDYHRLFPSLAVLWPQAADPQVVFHGLQAYEGDLNYLAVLVSFLRAASEAPLVAGGPLATLAPRETLEMTGVDLVLRGECEDSVVLLADLLARLRVPRERLAAYRQDLAGIPGIAFRESPEDYFVHPQVPFPHPVPYLPEEVDFWHETRRKAFPGAAAGACTYHLTASRGCPRRCAFCSHANGRRHRRYRWEDITARLTALQEGMARLQASGQVGRVCLNFGDDDFFYHREYAHRLLTFFRDQGLAQVCDIVVCGSIPSLVAQGRVDEELLEAVALSGVALLQLGTDAFCDEEIRHLKGGGYTTADIAALVRSLERRQIRNHHFWILSGPGTTLRSLIRQLLQAYHFQVSYRYFFVLWPNFYVMPLLGSRLRQECDRPEQRDLLVEREILSHGGGEQQRRFYARVLPRDRRAAAVLRLLEERLTPRMAGPVPYGFDFLAALSLAREYLEEERRRQPDREVEECLKWLSGRMEWEIPA